MSVHSILLEAHSGWRYIVLAILLLSVLWFAYGWLSNREWGAWDHRLGVATPIAVDIQVLLGLVLYVMGSYWKLDPLRAYEHPFTMIVALIAGHVTWVLVKQQTESKDKFRIATIGFAATAIVIIMGVLRIADSVL